MRHSARKAKPNGQNNIIKCASHLVSISHRYVSFAQASFIVASDTVVEPKENVPTQIYYTLYTESVCEIAGMSIGAV